MASHRRPKQPTRARTTVLTTAAAAVVALTAQSAQADPLPDPNKKGVKAEVDRLYEQATQATEKYNGAKEKHDKLQKQIDNLQDTVARGQDELNTLRDDLGSLATAQYRSGGVDPSVQLFLSSDPDSFLDKASVLDQLSSRQLSTLKKIQAKQRTLFQQREEASKKLADLGSTRKELTEKKEEIQGKLSQAQKLLNTLTAKERAKIAAEEERANRASERVELGNEASGSQRAAAAFAAAKSRVGMPYVWGATGPNSFDCSGLTSWAFNQAGVSIPRTSQAQASIGTRINSLSELKPGDLIIMRTDLSHVGFYAGNGQILHAPKPGAVVRYEAISTSGMPFMWGVRVG
ncbi:C40 family peptidase [Streptomyces sp. H28]|uniref:C40 family peptidase n=1 Tax=unclassified Streptomyces TaxID=2593676 RepID=UPI0017825364|nr:NlpC/P60 family protein [Streptomyces sp. H28]MBD9731390.1 C40 family peptidase [Streptomyces sp. H28]MBM7087208.1 C40 family peptidase [Streptomyces sp. S12]